MQRVNGMQAGKVKWFNNVKGYGFIVPNDNESQDLFAHYSAIQSDGYRTLRAGQDVDFELTDGPNGPQASNIILKSSLEPPQ
ncbi:MAG: CspA family cold shock protein [Candidatus Paceibacteria bacterium]|jgi:CspA family cold shock protein|tara:strand:- start:1919 stop:2164 length:246 start_codon:yes stop_codon:yes gene_type:complete